MGQSASVAVGALPLDRGRARRQERPELISTGNPSLVITPGWIRRCRQPRAALRTTSRRPGQFRRVDVDQPDPFAVAETNGISIMDRSDADSCCSGKDQWHAAAGNRSARPRGMKFLSRQEHRRERSDLPLSRLFRPHERATACDQPRLCPVLFRSSGTRGIFLRDAHHIIEVAAV